MNVHEKVMRSNYTSEETQHTQLSHSHAPNVRDTESHHYSCAVAEPAVPFNRVKPEDWQRLGGG